MCCNSRSQLIKSKTYKTVFSFSRQSWRTPEVDGADDVQDRQRGRSDEPGHQIACGNQSILHKSIFTCQTLIF